MIYLDDSLDIYVISFVIILENAVNNVYINHLLNFISVLSKKIVI